MISILIIVPTKNSSKFLEKLIISLLKQNDPNWRVVFIDYKSNKNQIKYLKNICNRNSRFSIVKQTSNKGIYDAQNIGSELCNHNEWILFWGSDDYASNTKVISNIREEIKKNINQDLIIFKGRYVNWETGLQRSKDHFSKFKTQNLVRYQYNKFLFLGFRQSHQGTLINPRLNIKNLRYDNKFSLAADLNFYLDCANKRNINVRTVDFNIVDIGIGGTSRKNHIQRFKEVLIIYLKHFNYLFFIPFFIRYTKW